MSADYYSTTLQVVGPLRGAGGGDAHGVSGILPSTRTHRERKGGGEGREGGREEGRGMEKCRELARAGEGDGRRHARAHIILLHILLHNQHCLAPSPVPHHQPPSASHQHSRLVTEDS